MKKHVQILKNGEEVVLRSLKRDDVQRSHAFFQSLPPGDRDYLRRDVTDIEVVRRRIRSTRGRRMKRIVALSGDRIVADGSLERDGEGWEAHIGELRLIVSPAFRRKGLGMYMARELYLLAAADGVEEIVVRMMRPQKDARKIFTRLGFLEDTTLPAYVKDLRGRKQDLIVMRCSLESLWKELEDYFAYTDRRRMS